MGGGLPYYVCSGYTTFLYTVYTKATTDGCCGAEEQATRHGKQGWMHNIWKVDSVGVQL